MKTILLAIAVWLVSTPHGHAQQARDSAPADGKTDSTSSPSRKATVHDIPHRDDETRLVEIKVNPDKYVGKTFVICGGVVIGDYYNYSYSEAKAIASSLDFYDVGKTTHSVGEMAHLYLDRKKGREFLDLMAKRGIAASEKGGKASPLLVRCKVTISAGAYAQNPEWDMMEVRDIQIISNDFKTWQPWMLEKQVSDDGDKASPNAQADVKAAKEVDEAKATRGKEEAAAERERAAQDRR